MNVIKKVRPENVAGELRELKEKISSLEAIVKSSRTNYSELIDLFRPTIQDLFDASHGQRVAREKQLSQPNGLFLLHITGALKGMQEKYGGKEDSEMARILELVVGFNSEGYRKMLSKGEFRITALEKDSTDNSTQQLIGFLKENKCIKTAELIQEN